MSTYKKILLAVDGSPTSDKAMAQIAKFAARGTTVRVINVMENPLVSYPMMDGNFTYTELLHDVNLADSQKLLAIAESCLRAQGFEVQTSLLDLRDLGGDIPGAIKAEADKWGADLTVLGTHGRRGVRRLLLGSVAEHFVRISERPVLLVHSGEPMIESGGKAAPAHEG